MVQDDGPVGLDGVRVAFEDRRAVSDAGIVLVATLAARLGTETLAARFVRLGDRVAAANAGHKVNDAAVRDGARRRLHRRCRRAALGAPVGAAGAGGGAVALGTFLRAFTFGHVRQLNRLLGETLKRAWAARAGPGEGRLVIDVDSFIGEVPGHAKQGAAFGYTRQRGSAPRRRTDHAGPGRGSG